MLILHNAIPENDLFNHEDTRALTTFYSEGVVTSLSKSRYIRRRGE